MNDVIIRNMDQSDIDFAFECTRTEGWLSETVNVFNSFFTHDPDGCFAAEINSERVGICVATKYVKNGFVGELIVVKDYRGRGIGSKLFGKAIDYLKSNGIENIYLDGDLGAVPIYEKFGFRKMCKSLRFVGPLKGSRKDNI